MVYSAPRFGLVIAWLFVALPSVHADGTNDALPLVTGVATTATNAAALKIDLDYIPPPTRTNAIDAWHAKWSSNVVSTARYLDNFFADPLLDEESNGTRVKLSLGALFKEREDAKLISRVNLRLHLPRTSRKLQLVVEDLVESDQSASGREIISDFQDSNPSASLRYNLSRKKRYKLDADAGIRTGDNDQVFIRLRAERRFDVTENLKLKLTESVYWYSADGWVSLTQMEFNQQLGWNLLFRTKSELEWAEEDDGVTPIQTFSLFKTLSKRRAIRWDVGGKWPESPNPSETMYYTSVAFRRLAYRDWLYLELTPGVEFPQVDDYEEKFFFKLQFDMILGGMQ